MTAIETRLGLPALRKRFKGALLEPGAAGWDAAAQAFNLTVKQEPDLVAVPADAADVSTLVSFARANGLQLAPQRTGHNAEPLGALDGVILVKTDALQGVRIDAKKRIARVAAGAKWENVVPQASELGLAALHGSTPDVSIAGYSLGGGVGWYARKLGLATNSVTAIELVTADGQLRRVDHDHDPELFWALRGGGGNFGIVTALEFELYPISEVYAGVLFFPFERASEVLHAWREWIATVPEEVTSVGRLLQFPPLPEVPEPIRGQSFVVVEAVVLGDEQEGAEHLRPIRELGPVMDTFAMVPPVGLAELHMDPPNPVPYTGGAGMLLGALPPAAIDRFVDAVGPGSGSTLVSSEIRHVGGAAGRTAPHHGALGALGGAFLTFGVGIVLDEESYRGSREYVARMSEALAPYDTGRQYLNFVEDHADPANFYSPDAYGRLRAVKAAVDPEEIFRANHPIKPAA
jgi:FAD/FMN-containing dehydrogenase